ncbi:MAG: hypothetical protein HC913_23520 [Microscillaceae bacterium]|nr:hypothetical protein [Microscillaceae bacterium]
MGGGFLLVGGLMYAFKSFWVGLYQKSTPASNLFFDYLLPFVFCLMILHLAESYARIHLQTVVSAFYKEVLLKVVILLSLLAFAGGFIRFEQLVGWRLSAFGVAGLGIFWFLSQRGWLRWGNPFRLYRANSCAKWWFMAALLCWAG